MSLINWTPLHEPFLDIERAFGDSLATFNPAIDLYEKDENIYVEVALAGIDPDNIKIKIENNVLNLEGSMEKQSEVDETNYYRKEVRSGGFHRMITLPTAVNGDNASAEYEKGILKIIIPKREEVRQKSIDIKVKK